MYSAIISIGGDLVSVRKNFRLSDFTNAMLEEVAIHLGKSQTDVIEQLVRDYIVYDMEATESKELLQRASEKTKTEKED